MKKIDNDIIEKCKKKIELTTEEVSELLDYQKVFLINIVLKNWLPITEREKENKIAVLKELREISYTWEI